MTTDSQPSEQPKLDRDSSAYPEFARLGPTPDPLSPEEREEWDRNSPPTRRPQRVSLGGSSTSARSGF